MMYSVAGELRVLAKSGAVYHDVESPASFMDTAL